MQVVAFTIADRVNSQANLTSSKTNANTVACRGQVSHKNFLTNTRETYNRYVVFKSRKAVTNPGVAILEKFLKEEAAPFLEKHKGLYEKNNAIDKKASEMCEIFDTRNRAELKIQSEGFKPEEIDFVKQNLQKPLKHIENIQEYNYLKEKSQNHFVSDETRKYVNEISEDIHKTTPYLDSFKSILSRYEKLKRDVKNGLADATLVKVAPDFSAKKDTVTKVSSESCLNNHFYTSALCFSEHVTELLEGTPNSEKIGRYLSGISQIRQAMASHEKCLPVMVQKATEMEEQLSNNSFNKEDVDAAFDAMGKKRNQIIERNVNRFKKHFDQHPEFVWEDGHNAEVDEILKKQHELNGKLWHKIEDDKKVYFSSSEKSDHKIFDYIFSDLPF